MQTIVPHMLYCPDAKGPRSPSIKKPSGERLKTTSSPLPTENASSTASLPLVTAPCYARRPIPEYSGNCDSAPRPPASSVPLHIHSPDVAKTIAVAGAAGATRIMPPSDMFWGDRYGQIRDPFGQTWSVGTPIKKLTPDQIKSAADAAFKKHPMPEQQQQQQQ